MDTAQFIVILTGAIASMAGVIAAMSKVIYGLQEKRITALEGENKTLRDEAKEAVKAKDAEIATLRDIAQKLSDERARTDESRTGRQA